MRGPDTICDIHLALQRMMLHRILKCSGDNPSWWHKPYATPRPHASTRRGRHRQSDAALILSFIAFSVRRACTKHWLKAKHTSRSKERDEFKTEWTRCKQSKMRQNGYPEGSYGVLHRTRVGPVTIQTSKS